MWLPKFLGNALGIRPNNELHPQVARYMEQRARGECHCRGQSFIKQITIPVGLRVHQAFSLDIREQLIAPQEVTLITNERIEVRVNANAYSHSIHQLFAGTTTVGFSDFYIEPYTRFWFDIENQGNSEAVVQCQLIVHYYCRAGDLIYPDAFAVAHIETPEEIAIREVREREAHQRRIEAEARAWGELETEVGVAVTTFLKESSDHWYGFRGNNDNVYAISGCGELANVTKGRRYCVQFIIGSSSGLPTPDVIMGKIKWCKLNASEVEEKANDIGVFDVDSSFIIEEVNDMLLGIRG